MYSLYLDRDGMDSVLMGVFETPEKAEDYVLENEDNFEGWDWILTDDPRFMYRVGNRSSRMNDEDRI
jgi:hypothetical protein